MVFDFENTLIGGFGNEKEIASLSSFILKSRRPKVRLNEMYVEKLAHVLQEKDSSTSVLVTGWEQTKETPTGAAVLYAIDEGGEFYAMDYFASFGEASEEILTYFAQEWGLELTEEDAVKLIDACLLNLMKSYPHMKNFYMIMKIVDQQGIRVLRSHIFSLYSRFTNNKIVLSMLGRPP